MTVFYKKLNYYCIYEATKIISYFINIVCLLITSTFIKKLESKVYDRTKAMLAMYLLTELLLGSDK